VLVSISEPFGFEGGVIGLGGVGMWFLSGLREDLGVGANSGSASWSISESCLESKESFELVSGEGL